VPVIRRLWCSVTLPLGMVRSRVVSMTAEDYRRKAQHFLNLAQQLSRPEERAVMFALAACWMEQQQREKEPEPSRKLVSEGLARLNS
jgi:hypothetical protein